MVRKVGKVAELLLDQQLVLLLHDLVVSAVDEDEPDVLTAQGAPVDVCVVELQVLRALCCGAAYKHCGPDARCVFFVLCDESQEEVATH